MYVCVYVCMYVFRYVCMYAIHGVVSSVSSRRERDFCVCVCVCVFKVNRVVNIYVYI